ncbi:hypothetical protein MJO29_016385 [Puccinia striiformis f. sp. tritici]|uniref:Pre-mRNA-splicing factor CWC24 n=1 Tax=Puccinia striiformis f. sp. tritici PST-78 TaxID=1165861 RepID=A0A0L0VZN3_9BASI|nr:hypothetical protein Pst134EA_030638 [Puccinia striiformis f. sp. tritici]KAI9600682.1 hypothetical protein H4Q26_000472 [Puccinia striiformis f. sp. tritici PST-130]KNF04744.1 hypothetical protein PSTG_02223 [Puccinia striiformis f. sp. tritici PST-78]KAH9440556.1 hypothetical protein Pst134EB_031165 [Puccinia striiformis f. sp. tritici]KAH9446731.1 hypothetical protein Pst134EA_030638 [Puccinia striiformis f. sp. tritici]KAI7935122.1 hypothetical protein MJO29_016385 [Puccinia striiformis
MTDNQPLEQTINETSIPQDKTVGEGPSTSSLFKKRSKKIAPNQIRKRTIDSEPGPILTNQDADHREASAVNQTKKSKLAHSHPTQEQQQAPVVKFTRRKNQRNYNPLYQGTSGSTKRLKAEQSESSEEEDEDEDEDKSKPRAVGVAYQAQGSARQQAEESYQKSIEEKRELGQKAREGLTEQDKDADDEPGPDNKTYVGTSKSKYQLPKGSQKYGPIKGGPNNIKTITVVDYQPDVCKDYKETGYCGFGDTCKFLHDRGDYMHGWQLDDAFNSRNNKTGPVESEEEEEVPFACLICRQPFTDPIVTKCQHYFCSGCAIKRFAKTPKCFACGTPTGGIFNKASRIIEKMKAKQERIQRQKEERRLEEAGLAGIEGLETRSSAEQDPEDEELGSERSFYEDE